MKRLALLIAVLVCICFIPATYAAEQLEVNNKGQIRLTPASENWRPLTSEEREACINPGKEIPADLSPIPPRRDSFFYLSPGWEYKKIVIYDNGRINNMEKEGKIYGEKKLALYIIFLLISALFMAASNLLSWKKRDVVTVAFVVVATLAATFAAAFAAATLAVADAAAVITAVITALAATLAATFNIFNIDYKNTDYKFLSVLFYIFVAIAMFV